MNIVICIQLPALKTLYFNLQGQTNRSAYNYKISTKHSVFHPESINRDPHDLCADETSEPRVTMVDLEQSSDVHHGRCARREFEVSSSAIQYNHWDTVLESVSAVETEACQMRDGVTVSGEVK